MRLRDTVSQEQGQANAGRALALKSCSASFLICAQRPAELSVLLKYCLAMTHTLLLQHLAS